MNTTELTKKDHCELKKFAVNVAQQLQPTNFSTQTGIANEVKRDVNKCVADAEIIYQFLIK